MNRKAGQQTYKEFQGQNYLEIKYSDKDFDQIGIEEAWEKYNANVILVFTLGKASWGYFQHYGG